jgi:hypothetical protein
MLNQTLTNDEKNKVIDFIKTFEVDIDRFFWSKRRKFLFVHSVLVYKPYGYYFSFKKEKEVILKNEYFPNWANQKDIEPSLNKIESSVNHWIQSIIRTNERKKDLAVSIDDGALKRKNFENFSKDILMKK